MSAGLGSDCAPFGINNSGQVVGAAFRPFSDVAFLFTHGAIYDLNTLIPSAAGWHLNGASGINDAGQIIGTGDFNGTQHWFRLDPSGPEFNGEEHERGIRKRHHKNRKFDRSEGERGDHH